MKKRRLVSGCWVIVCDGAKAIILENRGDEKFPNLRSIEVHSQKDFLTSEMGADKPARIHNSISPARSSIEQTDLHEQAERKFLEALVQRLNRSALEEKSRRFVIVAPPRALGVLRPNYSDATKDALIGELEKDYIKMPIGEIEQRVTAALAS